MLLIWSVELEKEPVLHHYLHPTAPPFTEWMCINKLQKRTIETEVTYPETPTIQYTAQNQERIFFSFLGQRVGCSQLARGDQANGAYYLIIPPLFFLLISEFLEQQTKHFESNLIGVYVEFYVKLCRPTLEIQERGVIA